MNSVKRNTYGGAIAQLAMDCGGAITWTRNCAIAEKVDTGKSRLYDDLSGRIMYTLVFQHHAERINIVGDNDIAGVHRR